MRLQMLAIPGLIVLFALAASVTMQYFLQLLQRTDWKVREYYHILSSENLRWLPLIFALVPAAAMLMGYGSSSYGFGALYLVLMGVCYWPWPRREQPEWTGKARRLMILWMIIWSLGGILIAVLTGLRSVWFIGIMTLLYVFQPALVPLLNLTDRPVAAWLGRHFVRGSRDILSLHHDLKIIAVTGKNEAAVLRGAMQRMLSSMYRCEEASQTVCTRMDAAHIIRDRKSPNLEYLICRIDADSEEEMRTILETLHPEIMIYASADYYSLLDDLLPRGGGFLFMNGDDPILRQYIGTERVLTYGLGAENDCAGRILRVDGSGTDYVIAGLGREVTADAFAESADRPKDAVFHTALLGEENITFLVGAACVSYSLGVPPDQLQRVAASLRPVPGRLEILQYYKPDVVVIDDSANEDSLAGEEALETLQRFAGMRILITDGFQQQGAIHETANRNFGAKAAQTCDRIILVGENVAYGLKNGILEAGFRPESIYETSARCDALSLAEAWETEQDKIILLEAPE